MITRSRLLATVSFCLLSAFAGGTAVQASIIAEYYPLVLGGDPDGTPSDSPANRVDPNTTTSPFAGVGSLRVSGDFGNYRASAVPISRYHILTAAHTLDPNNNGISDALPSGVTFNLNFGGNLTHSIVAADLAIHPDFTGFSSSLINDDLAIITLSSPLPDGVPIYDLYRDTVELGVVITMVGYGRSGDGVGGFSTSSSNTVKRTGQNVIDLFGEDDEGVGSDEIFTFDFDGPDDTTNMIDILYTAHPTRDNFTLGNEIEGQLGPGDSGSPSFIFDDGQWKIVGINTVAGQFEDDSVPPLFGPAPPLFGSAGGGMLISAYTGWIDSVIIPEPASIVVWSLLVAVMLPLARSPKLRRQS